MQQQSLSMRQMSVRLTSSANTNAAAGAGAGGGGGRGNFAVTSPLLTAQAAGANHESNRTLRVASDLGDEEGHDEDEGENSLVTVGSAQQLVQGWLAEKRSQVLLRRHASTHQFEQWKGELRHVAESDPLYRLLDHEKDIVWRCRRFLVGDPAMLPKFLLSVEWSNGAAVAEAHRLLRQWEPPSPLEALQLLDAKFPDPRVRAFAVSCLEAIADEELEKYLLQLTKVL